MTFPYDEALRSRIVDRCASFPHQSAREPAAGLKRAAVAILLL